MKVNHILGCSLACLVGLAATAAWTPAHALSLTFDGNICGGGTSCSNFELIDQSYGDTAQVDVVYSSISSPGEPGLRWWSTDYNDLENVAWTNPGDTTSVAQIFLNPALGFQVTLNSFDLGAFANTTRNSQFTIFNGTGSTVLASSGGIIPIGFGSTTHNSFSFNLTSADGVRIQWGPSAFNVGIDNVNFTVSPASAVPEPGTILLLSSGLAGLFAWRYRKQS